MIIMICSQLPSQGKDLATQFLVENFDGVRVAFADKLKDYAKSLTWDGNKDTKGRTFLIDLGCICRKYNQNIWVEKTTEKIDDIILRGNSVIVSDFRFLSEYTYLKQYYKDIIILGIESNILGNKEFANNESQIEYNIIKKDYVIENNGTIEEFKNKILKIMEDINNVK